MFILKAIQLMKKMYWFGCFGLFGTLLDYPYLSLFYLFFLLAPIELVLSLIYDLKKEEHSSKTSDLKFLFQNLGMLIGIPIIYMRCWFHLPDHHYKAKVSYRLPFDGEWLTVNGGLDKETSHSWSICNQRYAYDFYIDQEGKSYRTDGKTVSDYYCYGELVLSPADGVVVDIKDGFEDTPISENGEIQCLASDIRGNYIVIHHGEKEYTTIAHLKKGSILVKVGDYVSQGQPIARCGNSGNTSEPHIHFQLQQGKSFLFSASLPIYFDGIQETLESTDIHYLTRGQRVTNIKKNK